MAGKGLERLIPQTDLSDDVCGRNQIDGLSLWMQPGRTVNTQRHGLSARAGRVILSQLPVYLRNLFILPLFFTLRIQLLLMYFKYRLWYKLDVFLWNLRSFLQIKKLSPLLASQEKEKASIPPL